MQLHSDPSKTRPAHILQAIVQHKQQEVAQMYAQTPLLHLLSEVNKAPAPHNFAHALRQATQPPSVIAEVKKASPSKGIIRPDFDPVAIAQAYERGGAACLSVLTDQKYFQGSFDSLRQIRQHVSIPLLCKEFIIDPYQIYLARASGADAVLLIAAILSDRDLQDYLHIIHSLGMDALVEVHTLAELDRVLQLSELRLLGINNRDLQTFTVDLKTTEELIQARQAQLQGLNTTLVSESGLFTRPDLERVAQAGANAVLIGESLVKQSDVEQAVRALVAGSKQQQM